MVHKYSRNVHALDIPKKSTFLLLSDLHWDNPKCDRELLKNHLDEAVRRKAYIVVNGDLFCLMQGKYDPRRSKKDILPEHNKANYLDAVVDDAIEWFAPYAQHLVLVGYGNHETAIIKNVETDPLQRFAYGLQTKYGSPVQVGGYGGVLHLRNALSKTGSRQSFVIHYYHGYGGGGAVTKGVIQDQRIMAMSEGYDLIWQGHVHELYHHVNTVHSYDAINKRIKQRDVHQLRTSAYKEEYEDGYGGFHIERGRPPKPMGGYWLHLEFGKRRQDGTDKMYCYPNLEQCSRFY